MYTENSEIFWKNFRYKELIYKPDFSELARRQMLKNPSYISASHEVIMGFEFLGKSPNVWNTIRISQRLIALKITSIGIMDKIDD